VEAAVMWWRSFSLTSAFVMMAALPSSTGYKLDSYGFGSGGTAHSSSTNYGLNGLTGETAGTGSSTNYKIGAGENYEKQANVPLASLSNGGLWYNKLLLTIDPQSNPSDALFAVAISKDNFTTTQYVKSDFTVGNTLTFSDYLTYAAWGSGSGQLVRGLSPGSVYTVKAKAYHGKYTESGYGPASAAATTDVPQLTFDIDVSTTNQSTSPPYAVSFGSLPVSTVTDAPQKIWVSLDTNGESGGKVYLSGQNGGLVSSASNYTITSVTGDLASLLEGFGVQGSSATQTSGGPFTLVAPFDGAGANVGIENSTIQEVFNTDFPIVAGRGSLTLKAKTKPLTPASGDYSEILTMVASASF
jgi:hypothetical protein